MDRETVLFVAPGSGDLPNASLAFAPRRLLSVSSATGETLFHPERDYLWSPGTRTFRLPSASRISFLTDADLYPPRGSQKHGTCRCRATGLLFGETAEFHRCQIAIQYEHTLDQWQTPSSLITPTPLPKLKKKLLARQLLSVFLLGDSISAGMNASGWCGVPPYQSGYGQLIADAISAHFSVEVQFHNLSVTASTRKPSGRSFNTCNNKNIPISMYKQKPLCSPKSRCLPMPLSFFKAIPSPTPTAPVICNKSRIQTSALAADMLRASPPDFSPITPINGSRPYRGISGKRITDLYARIREDILNLREKLPNVQLVLCEPFLLPSGNVQSSWREELKPYRSAVHQLAADFHSVFVPFQQILDDASRKAPPEYWTADGTHPTPAGHELLAHAWINASQSA